LDFFNELLERLRDWFQEHRVDPVAMEATGVYWLYGYEVLDAAGLEVEAVNGRPVQNVPGRKGCSLRSTVRLTGVAKKTVSRILAEARPAGLAAGRN
jgi:transposase